MKKLTIIAIAVALAAVFAVTAAANEWNLYGSARVQTFWTSQDLGEDAPDDFGRDSVDDLRWRLEPNARIGAKVKGDMISAQFEYGASGGNANIRRLYGVWNFTEGWGLKVGQDYTPITFFLSGQAFDIDQGLLQVGNAYGGRRAQIAVEGQGFKVALIEPLTGRLERTPAPGITVDNTTEKYFPKVEASYEMKFGDGMSAHVFGGWQAFDLLQAVTTTATGVVQQESDAVQSYMVGVGADLGFGPFYVKPQFSWYQNGAIAGWLNADLGLGGVDVSQLPFLDANGDIVDIDSLMAMLALGFKFSEGLGLEAGIGYLSSDGDKGFENTYLEYYLQAVVTLAKGVYLVPELGYRDYGDLETDLGDTDLGDLWYFGAKWQIDF